MGVFGLDGMIIFKNIWYEVVENSRKNNMNFLFEKVKELCDW